jgi:hypothetical protein
MRRAVLTSWLSVSFWVFMAASGDAGYYSGASAPGDRPLAAGPKVSAVCNSVKPAVIGSGNGMTGHCTGIPVDCGIVN